MKTTFALGCATLLSLAAVGCSSSSSSDQIITGRIAQTSFPAQVTAVRAYLGTTRIAEAPVAADGSFSLGVPAGTGARIQLVSATPSRLIFPRAGGTIDVAFSIQAGGAGFDLGTVRHVGDPTGHHFSFHTSSSEDQECEDGVDSTGATCVEDEDENGGACEGSDSNESGDDSTDTGDGTTDTGTTDGTDDGSGDGSGDGDHDETDDAANEDQPTDTAVADHNFPADGCNADDESGDDSTDDGSDSGSDDSGSDSAGL